MIRSMQRRLAVVVLLFLVAVYACLCAVSYGAAVSSMVRESEQMLRSLAEPDPPMGGRIFPGQVGVPYFTLLVDGRGVLEDADQGQFDISDEELLDLAAQVLTAEEDFGYLGSYQLRYYRVSIPAAGGWCLPTTASRRSSACGRCGTACCWGWLCCRCFWPSPGFWRD